MIWRYWGINKPTSSEYKVLGCLVFSAPVILGAALLYFGYRADEEKQDLADYAVNTGWTILITIIAILLIWMLIKKYVIK
jgi:hypothetical protein